MDITKFWQLIDETRIASNGDVNKQAALLVDKVASLSVEEIIEYERIFDKLERRVRNRHDLSDIADFIGGGLGDDGLLDFAGWLIGQGQVTYDKVLADPEALADIVSVEDHDHIVAESLLYAAYYAYEKKTGEEYWLNYKILPDELPPVVESPIKGFSNVEEYYALFKEKYPKVWAKFRE